MVGVAARLKTAIGARGLVAVALALALLAHLAGGADHAALATVHLVIFQVDASFVAAREAEFANTLPGFADLGRAASLIAVTAMLGIGLGVDAGLAADQQVATFLHALALGTKTIAGRMTTTTMHGVGVRIDASIATFDLAGATHQVAAAHQARPTAGAGFATLATMVGGAIGVDADLVADLVGPRAFGVARPANAEIGGRAGDPTSTTMVEAGLGVDAATLTRRAETGAVDETFSASAHFAVEAGLAAPSTIHDVEIGVDAATVAIRMIRIQAGPSRIIIARIGSICANIADLRRPAKVRVRFPTTQHRHQREQDQPHLFLNRQLDQPSPDPSGGQPNE